MPVNYNHKAGADQWGPVIDAASRQTGVPAGIIEAVIDAESNGNPSIMSPVGAKGLMQLMDGTAAGLGVHNSYDPYQNVLAGARYLRQNYDTFKDWRKAIAAYNAGPGAVQKYGGVPPYKETQKYLSRIESYLTAKQR